MAANTRKRLFNSIVSKVRLSILGTATIAVVVSGVFVVATEFVTYRDGFVDNVSGFSDVLAHNLSASIVFDNSAEATDRLNSLATIPSVELAFVTAPDGELFATYTRSDWPTSEPLPDPVLWVGETDAGAGNNVANRVLRYGTPVVLDDEQVGMLLVQASLDEIYERLQFQLMTLAAILFIALLIATLAGNAMQRFITVPIQQLVVAMRNVSNTRTYDVNIGKKNDDEIGVLVDGFNEMLQEIHARDRLLADANDQLEGQVKERTKELEKAYEKLSRTLDDVEHAKDAAEAANRAKGAFLATMSHEIRTPINGLLGNTELLLNEPLNEAARQYGEIAYQSGEALLDIINDILDFSRIEAGKLELTEAEFDLGRVANQLCLSLKPQIEQKGIDLQVDLDDAPAHLVVGDSGRVRQVLSNLIANAAKFTEKGYIRVSAQTQTGGDGCALVRFDVEDSGIGIRPDDQELIFGRFAQADDSASRSFGGTGLGLAICEELVTRMGGEIGLTSEYGKGATFWFTLRLAITDEPAGQPVLDEAVCPRTENAGQKLDCRVLVVDDNEINRDMASQMLSKLGCTTDTAANGERAVDMVAAGDYGIVFMDCQMPVMDGFRATRRIRVEEEGGSRKPTYIVALTANAIKGDRDRCIQAGMDDYLTKPFKLADLRAAVEKAITRSAEQHPNLSAGETPAPAILDPEAIESIRSIDSSSNDALFRRYASMYLESTPGLLDRMSSGLDSRNSEELCFAAHSLKSDSFAVGAIALGNIAKDLELLGREQSFTGAEEMLEEARVEFDRVRSALNNELKAS